VAAAACIFFARLRGRMVMVEMLTPIASNPEHLMSSIVAFARSRLSPDWFHQLCGEALPAGTADPILLRRYSYSHSLRPAGLLAHLRQSGKSSSAAEFFPSFRTPSTIQHP
jgi:hypothetical protein